MTNQGEYLMSQPRFEMATPRIRLERYHYTRAAQILGVRSPERLHFVWRRLIFVGLQYETCFKSPFWGLEFGDCAWFFFLRICGPPHDTSLVGSNSSMTQHISYDKFQKLHTNVTHYDDGSETLHKWAHFSVITFAMPWFHSTS
jgi:hypothetical protein